MANKHDAQSGSAVSSSELVSCECGLATRLVGDGCKKCNPELAAEMKWNSEADEHNQWNMLGGDEKNELIAKQKAANAPGERLPGQPKT